MEATEQRDFVLWFAAEYPQHVRALRVSAAGLPRGGGKKGAIQWNMMKGQGVQKGEADIGVCIARGEYGSYFTEHKGLGMARKIEDHQQEYLDYHNTIGNFATSTRGLKELIASVKTYMEQ